MSDSTTHLLLVEDEAPLREAVAERLADHGFDVVQAEHGRARARGTRGVRLRHPRHRPAAAGHGRPAGHRRRASSAIPTSSPSSSPATAPCAMPSSRSSAAPTDFVTKPFQFEELLHALNGALEQRRLQVRERLPARAAQERYQFDGIVGRSRAMRELFQLLETVAPTASTILMTGETGTGKEVVGARHPPQQPAPRAAVRRASTAARFPRRCSRPSCSATCEARSPARSARARGGFEQAHRGTLFLDEVGTMSTSLQIEAAARAAGAGVRARRRVADDQGRCAGDCRDQRRPAAHGRGRHVSRRPVLPAERHSRCGCRRCGSGRKTSPCSSHFLEKFCTEREPRPA